MGGGDGGLSGWGWWWAKWVGMVVGWKSWDLKFTTSDKIIKRATTFDFIE